jgi:hypothetical protein
MVPVVEVPAVAPVVVAGNAVTMVTRAVAEEPVAELLVCKHRQASHSQMR